MSDDATGGNRTPDARGFSAALYHLSYRGNGVCTPVTAASDSDTQGVAFASERSANDGHSVFVHDRLSNSAQNEIAPPANRAQVGRFSGGASGFSRFASPMDPLHTRHPARAGH